jgi:hypothetical protein
VPNTGVLSFDYVSATVPPPDAVPINDDQLLEFLHHRLGIGLDSATGALIPETDHTKGDVQVRYVAPAYFSSHCTEAC